MKLQETANAIGTTKQARRKLKHIGKELMARNLKLSDFGNPDKVGGIKEMVDLNEDISWGDLMMAQQIYLAAVEGDTTAFKTVRDTIGEKPTDKVHQTIEDQSPLAHMTNEQLEERRKMLKEMAEYGDK